MRLIAELLFLRRKIGMEEEWFEKYFDFEVDEKVVSAMFWGNRTKPVNTYFWV